MLRPNHLDNFGTNLTSNTNASDTTSPLNSIPSIDAPFWMAFDATNVNGHYERKLITSKTATNVLHSALAYDHTTAEEVRIVNPSEEFDAIYQPPQGFLINGKIVPSVTSNNLTVALKTLAGNDPSETDPVFIRIGDAVYTIISALATTAPAGTNWSNSGSSKLAGNEIDYFVYVFFVSASSTVRIGFSRIPSITTMGEFSGYGSTNEKSLYCDATGVVSGDVCENIGRFAATLSAGAGYTWSVPTFTASNLFQRPTSESRLLNIGTPINITLGNGTLTNQYKIRGNEMTLWCSFVYGSGSSIGGTISFNLPFLGKDRGGFSQLCILDSGTNNFSYLMDLSAGVSTGSIGNYIITSNNAPQVLDATHPITFAAGDTISVNYHGFIA